jgi:transposase
MMGHRQVEQAALFYEFSLERHIPVDHLLRSIDRFVDLEDLRRELAPFYSNIGRPSIDPDLMIRMLLIGYCFGIRSERRLCDEVHLNLAYRWFCRLGLDGAVPDHSSSRRTGTAASVRAISSVAYSNHLAPLHSGAACRWRRVCSRREPDQGGC